MSDVITAHFDGKTIVPDQPLDLKAGQKLRVRIESVEPTRYPLEEIRELAVDMGIEDLSTRHRHFAHPEPKNGD